MLRYLNAGERDRGNDAWRGKADEVRRNWEFMAIVDGRAKPHCADGSNFRFLSKQLWIMPPHSRHSWTVPKNSKCRVIVMHFANLPEVMQHYISYEKPTHIRLTTDDVTTLEKIYNEVHPHYQLPKLGCIIWFEKALVDLCIFITGKLRHKIQRTCYDSTAIKIQQAQDWYLTNLVRSPKVEDVARALDISTTMLNRIFKSRLKKKTSRALQQLALEQSCRLMVESTLSLKEIAFQCGFVNPGQFYRAFQKHLHVPPSEWRENRFYGNLGLKSNRS